MFGLTGLWFEKDETRQTYRILLRKTFRLKKPKNLERPTRKARPSQARLGQCSKSLRFCQTCKNRIYLETINYVIYNVHKVILSYSRKSIHTVPIA